MDTVSMLVGVMAATGWVARDAARRGQAWGRWSVAVFFTGALGIILWLFVRRRTPVVQRLSVVRGTLLTLVGVGLFILCFPTFVFVTTFLFQVARVQGESMAPTLQNGSRVIVNKLAYRMGEPRIGDVVMFYYPLRPKSTFAQRVIAAEGDQVRIDDGRVYRNNVAMDDSFVRPDYRSHEDWGPQVVPEGYYFVMGDHRNKSSDSRHWGFVPKRYIIGRIVKGR